MKTLKLFGPECIQTKENHLLFAFMVQFQPLSEIATEQSTKSQSTPVS